jgi:hypothetical protein
MVPSGARVASPGDPPRGDAREGYRLRIRVVRCRYLPQADALFEVREDVGRAGDNEPVLPHAPHAASRL